MGNLKKYLSSAKKAKEFLSGSKGNDVVKNPWRYSLDKLLGGSISTKRIDSEIDRLSRESRKRVGALKRSKFNGQEYIGQVEDWLKYEPKTEDEKKAKLATLAKFAGDDRISTVKGLKKELGAYEQIYADVINNKLADSAIGYSFYKLFMRETGNKNLNNFENSEAIAQAIMDWRLAR